MQCAEPDDMLRYASKLSGSVDASTGWQATAGAMFAQQSACGLPDFSNFFQ
jgi:hypothetical protein